MRALRLLNEWRDTLYYSAILFVLLVTVLAGNKIEWHHAMMAVVSRELLRQWGWMVRPPMIPASYRGPRFNPFDLACACGVVVLGTDAIDTLFYNTPLFLMGGTRSAILTTGILVICASGATFAFAMVGGWRGVVRAYAETMWDWPRKRDGGGETQKLLEAVQAWGTGWLIPQAVHGAGRAGTVCPNTGNFSLR